ncbi:MAG TPA: glycosyltransferase family 39 protein [Anaerolineales bacterium]|nr:glycosyltransferase family 39 protein [Anaerolineales bacterium]
MKSQKAKLILVLVIFLLTRLAGLVTRPIWYDEAFSILFSEKGLNAMIYGTLSQSGSGAADIHPLGYYVFLWAWMRVFGTSILAARLLSIFISLAALVLVYLIARELFDETTAWISALLFSILPFQVHFAQEIRMYMLLSFWLLAATYAFLRGRSGEWKWWLLFGVCSALAQYTHHLASVYLIPLALTPLWQKDWKTLKSVMAGALLAVLLYIPWLIHLPAQLSKVQSSYWVERPGLEKIFTLILFYLPHLPLPNGLLLPGLLIAMLVIVLAVFQTILAKRNLIANTGKATWLAMLAFLPPLLLWVISQFVPVYIERALLPSHAIFCIWLAWAFTQTRLPNPVRIFTFTLIGIAAVIGLSQHFFYQGFPYGPFREINQSIQSRLENGDAIIHSSKLSYLPSFYFNRKLVQTFIIDPPQSNVDTLAPATREVLQIRSAEDIETASANATRIWFIIYQQSVDEYTAQGYKTHPHLEGLEENYELEFIENWDDVRIYLYVKKP